MAEFADEILLRPDDLILQLHHIGLRGGAVAAGMAGHDMADVQLAQFAP